MVLNRLILVMSLLITGCASVTIKPGGGAEIKSPPTYEESKSYFFLWAVGETRVDVNSVCNGSQPKQMQSLVTIKNYFFTIWTFGIYSPYTVKVWC